MDKIRSPQFERYMLPLHTPISSLIGFPTAQGFNFFFFPILSNVPSRHGLRFSRNDAPTNFLLQAALAYSIMAFGICMSPLTQDGSAASCLIFSRCTKIIRSSMQHNRHVVKVNLDSRTRISKWMEPQISYTQLNCTKLHVICGMEKIGAVSKIGMAEKDLRLRVRYIMDALKQWQKAHLVIIVGLLTCTFLVIPSAGAVDALKTCACLLKECRVELAKCVANPSCAANIACLQTCNNRPDETECQIKCGDLFENKVVDEFNECAVSRKKCVPTKSDIGEFPVPDPSALVKSFNISDFTGKWYISSGLNPTFDAFDCQLHDFHVEENRLIGNLSWRIRTPDSGFFTRTAVQKFVQDPSQPGILYNHDNEYLHYQDDWYVLSSSIENKEDDYVFVYYRGRNDAWDGYGGAFVYTRSATLPESIVPELERASKSVGRDFSKFIRTDNSCGPEPPLVERIEKTVEQGERSIIREVEEIEEEVEKEVERVEETELSLFQKLADGFQEVKRDVQNFIVGLSKEEMEILSDLKMEASELEKVFGRSLPIRKLR